MGSNVSVFHGDSPQCSCDEMGGSMRHLRVRDPYRYLLTLYVSSGE